MVDFTFEFSRNPDHHRDIVRDGKVIGYVTKPQFGKGYFVYLDGVLWQNAPGARFTHDAGFAKGTHCGSMKQAEYRIEQALKEKANG